MTERYLTREDLALMFNCDKQTIDRWSKDPSHAFPKGFHIGHRPLWDAHDIKQFVATLRGAETTEAA